MNTLVTVILVSCTTSLCLAVSVSEQLSSGGFTRMSQVLNASGLNETVQGKGPFTIFVPNDKAFQNATLPTDKQQLSSIIKNHVIEGQNLTSQNITGTWKTLGGSTLNISKSANGSVLINNTTQITKPDIMTDNGVIHEINSVLLPSANATSSSQNQTAAAPPSANATNASSSEQPPANASYFLETV